MKLVIGVRRDPKPYVVTKIVKKLAIASRVSQISIILRRPNLSARAPKASMSPPKTTA
jgi:hypothetical protein